MHNLLLRSVVLIFDYNSFNFAKNNIIITCLDNRFTSNLDIFIKIARTI